jgi:adenine-specific DNA-methyltransferase
MDNQFSKLSKDITKSLSKTDKKNDGIFFTPHCIIKKTCDFIIDYINKNKLNVKNILEPSCGSCEFIDYIDKHMAKVDIDGIEKNEEIYDKIKELSFNNKINIRNDDFLEDDNKKTYGWIVGNPPYYVMKKKDVNKNYSKYYEGRPNIFIIFIIKSLELLNDKGILSFVLPKNFLNCLYYDKLRVHISKKFKILDIIDHSNETYIDTDQNTCMFIIQKCEGCKNDKFMLKINGHIIFNTIEDIQKIKALYENTTTLDKMGFDVKVGNVVWNQVKDILVDNSKKTRLIYSGDIKGNKLSIANHTDDKKKHYIDKKGTKEVLLIVNRGYGKGKYAFNYCLIDMDKEYLIENHIIYIKYRNQIDKPKLLELYNIIINSFENEKTKKFIKLYFENNAINTIELQHMIPIF